MIDRYLLREGQFEDIPFNSRDRRIREALAELLRTLRLPVPARSIDELFHDGAHGFGFVSLIRCSVTMEHLGEKATHSDVGILHRTMKADLPFVDHCLESHLRNSPDTVRLAVVLGAEKRYVQACRKRLAGVPLDGNVEVPYAYTCNGKVIVHIPHPSGNAAGYRKVFNGRRRPSEREIDMLECRRQALAAVAMSGVLSA